jgi:hypothetical protein
MGYFGGCISFMQGLEAFTVAKRVVRTGIKNKDACMHTRLLLSFFIWVQATVSAAQDSRFSGWFFNLNTIKLSQKTSIHFDAQLRTSDEWKYVETLILRPGLNFHTNKKTILTLGYAFVEGWRNIGEVRGPLSEHRIWQQLMLPWPDRTIRVTHRFRLEERFIPVPALDNDEIVRQSTAYSSRFRYFVRTLLPLMHAKTFTRGSFLALQNEVFLNLTGLDEVNGKFFDQNRLYLAAGWRFGSTIDMEAGYMYQYVSGRTTDINNHILQLAVYLRL